MKCRFFILEVMKIINLSDGERIFTERRIAKYRGGEYAYTHIGIVDKDGHKCTTTELDEINYEQVKNLHNAERFILIKNI